MNAIVELPSILLIAGITVFVSWSSGKSAGFFKKLYQWIPPILFLYLLPTIATNSGLVAKGNTIRELSMDVILPVSLILLTSIIHIPDLLNLTRKGLVVFLFGTLGIVIGGPISLYVYGLIDPVVLTAAGEQATWRGLICIAGSWINGTPGLLSMKEVYGSSESLFLTSLAADVILQNIWMFFLLYSVKIQHPINRWLTGRKEIDFTSIETEQKENAVVGKKKFQAYFFQFIVLGLVYLLIIFLSDFCSSYFTTKLTMADSDTFSFLEKKSFWLILFATTFGLVLSITNLFKNAIQFWTKLGNTMLFFVIASIGSQLELGNITLDYSFFIIGIMWLLMHLFFLVVGAKLIKAPWHYIAIGSQANIGGPASASVVAVSFHLGLASLGIILGVLSNVIGNYANLITGALFQWVTF
jgi:uncharacterized membrane protein